MADDLPRSVRSADDSLAIRAAWLHFAGGLTQAEVARRLSVPPLKAHRLIARATEAGAVRVTVDGDIADCLALEDALAARYGLAVAEVAPDLGEDGLPLRALGLAGAAYLRRMIDAAAAGGVIGIGHGRTLQAAVAALPRHDAGGVRFVSLLGGLARNYAANPHDVMHRLAEKTGAEAYVMPVPFFANSAEDREVLLAQRGVAEVAALAATADVMLAGIGGVEPQTQLVASRMIDASDIAEARARGAVGELLGHFFAADGAPVDTPLAARTLTLPRAAMAGRRIVALAGGTDKTAAIRAVLRSGVLAGLVTDERTALALTHDDPLGGGKA